MKNVISTRHITDNIYIDLVKVTGIDERIEILASNSRFIEDIEKSREKIPTTSISTNDLLSTVLMNCSWNTVGNFLGIKYDNGKYYTTNSSNTELPEEEVRNRAIKILGNTVFMKKSQITNNSSSFNMYTSFFQKENIINKYKAQNQETLKSTKTTTPSITYL